MSFTVFKYRTPNPFLSLMCSVASCQSLRCFGTETNSLLLPLILASLYAITAALTDLNYSKPDTFNCPIAPGLLFLLWLYVDINAVANCLTELLHVMHSIKRGLTLSYKVCSNTEKKIR